MAEKEEGDRRAGVKLRIVPEVSIADLLTIMGIGLPLLVWGARLDARVEQIERQIAELRIDDQRQSSERDKLRLEVRDELREIRKDIGAVAATLGSYTSGRATNGR